ACAVPARQCGTYRGCDVIVPGRDVGHEWTKYVKRGLAAFDRLLLHVHGDLVHWDVPGTLDHHLAAPRPGAPGELAQRLELGKLSRIGSVGDRARPEAIAQAPRDVVLPHDVTEVIEAAVDRVFLLVSDHPLGHERPAARDDSGHAVRCERDVLAED